MIKFLSFLLVSFLFFESANALPILASQNYADRVVGEKESLANKITSFDGEITDDTKYPSALAVKTALDTKVNVSDLATKIAEAVTGKEDTSNKVVNFEGADDTKYPSALAVKTALDTKVDISAEATQTLNGNYTVAGSLIVPTQPLPE